MVFLCYYIVMDIRRLSLWEGRYATYMSNETFAALIEDQGEVLLEMSVRNPSGARISPLSLPYFRGTGSGVMSDENGQWWRMNQGLYQAGGAYFNFPSGSDDIINTSNTYWTLRRYGTEDEFGGVWKYSEMKSRTPGNRYKAGRVDLILPGHEGVYTAISITNLDDVEIKGNAKWVSMLSDPLVEKGSYMNTNSHAFCVYPLTYRESGVNRFVPNVVFEDLRNAPLLRGGTADASVVPPPTGTYDYIMGETGSDSVSWVSVVNPSDQMMYLVFTPKTGNESEYILPYCTIGENWYGRMDSPWALFDGATPQIRSLSLGFAAGERGSENFVLAPGETKVMYFGNIYTMIESQRIAGFGFFSNEVTKDGFLLKRTRHESLIKADTSFRAIRKLSRKIFLKSSSTVDDSEQQQ